MTKLFWVAIAFLALASQFVAAQHIEDSRDGIQQATPTDKFDVDR